MNNVRILASWQLQHYFFVTVSEIKVLVILVSISNTLLSKLIFFIPVRIPNNSSVSMYSDAPTLFSRFWENHLPLFILAKVLLSVFVVKIYSFQVTAISMVNSLYMVVFCTLSILLFICKWRFCHSIFCKSSEQCRWLSKFLLYW